MVNAVRKSVLGFALVVAVMAATPAANAAVDSSTLRFKGLTEFSYFYSLTDCGAVWAGENATESRATLSRDGSKEEVNVFTYIVIYNNCLPEPSWTSFFCTSDSAMVDIDPSLAGATVNGTLTCTNYDTGATCELSKSVTVQGVGDTIREMLHYQFQQGGFLYTQNTRFVGREAQVTSATLSGCGVFLTEQQAVSAGLQNVNYGTVTVIRE